MAANSNDIVSRVVRRRISRVGMLRYLNWLEGAAPPPGSNSRVPTQFVDVRAWLLAAGRGGGAASGAV